MLFAVLGPSLPWYLDLASFALIFLFLLFVFAAVRRLIGRYLASTNAAYQMPPLRFYWGLTPRRKR